MAEQWKRYVNDPRTICKYGARCYQKSPSHLDKFKHPPQNLKRKNFFDHRFGRPNKLPEKLVAHSDESEETRMEAASPKTAPTSSVVSDTIQSHNDDLLAKLKYYPSNESPEDLLRDLFLVDMPRDFYEFFKYIQDDCKDVNEMLSSVNLELIGPFDLLLGKLPIQSDKNLYLVHWRFYFDPPEFQAILKCKGNSQHHYGYYRDFPREYPVFVGSNDSSKDYQITPVAYNIFGAVYLHLQNEKKKSPFAAVSSQKLMDKLKKLAEELNLPITPYDMKSRMSQILTKTLHGAGIVGPYNKKTKLGYRPLTETNTQLKNMFKKLGSCSSQEEKDKMLAELQPLITYANIAVDECDFLTGLECGINLFCSGIKELEASAISCMCSAYLLLKRPEFAKILEAHMKYRRKGSNLSLLSLNDKV